MMLEIKTPTPVKYLQHLTTKIMLKSLLILILLEMLEMLEVFSETYHGNHINANIAVIKANQKIKY
jgi:hypothetical protein